MFGGNGLGFIKLPFYCLLSFFCLCACLVLSVCGPRCLN